MNKKISKEPDHLFLRCAHLILPYLPPPSLASAATTCSYLHRLSFQVTSRRLSDASRSFEKHTIPFLNSVSPYPPYSYFLYTPSSVSNPPTSQSWGGSVSGPGSAPPLRETDAGDFGVGSGCECLRDCSEHPNGCRCWGLGFECGGRCGCGSGCGNRATQRGIRVRLEIVRDARKGWGLHAAEFVKKGEFICEYAGEYLTTEEARRRQSIYDNLASNGKLSPALLVVREHLPSGKACLRVNIDATKVGNVARFINHSCDGGNLSAILVRKSGSLLPRLCFFAAIDISEGQELTFSYGDARVRPKGLPCFCGTEVCCGQLPSEDT